MFPNVRVVVKYFESYFLRFVSSFKFRSCFIKWVCILSTLIFSCFDLRFFLYLNSCLAREFT